MASRNVELIRSAFDAWNRGEIEAFIDHMGEDVVWVEVSGRPEGVANERPGRDRLRESFKSLFEVWETYRLEVERIEELGDRVLAILREVARGRASGVEVDGRWGYLITMRDGEMVRVEAYREADQALEIAGLGESHTGA